MTTAAKPNNINDSMKESLLNTNSMVSDNRNTITPVTTMANHKSQLEPIAEETPKKPKVE